MLSSFLFVFALNGKDWAKANCKYLFDCGHSCMPCSSLEYWHFEIEIICPYLATKTKSVIACYMLCTFVMCDNDTYVWTKHNIKVDVHRNSDDICSTNPYFGKTSIGIAVKI
jgi:hypothetical protein